MCTILIRYLYFASVWSIASICYIFIYPLLPKNNDKFKWEWADNIWGNSTDGLDGDYSYQDNQAKMTIINLAPNYFWGLRNPANNLLRHTLNAEGIIKTIDVKGHLTIVTFMDGRRFFFYYNEGGKYIVKFGWRFWAGEIKVGEKYNASFVFNP